MKFHQVILELLRKLKNPDGDPDGNPDGQPGNIMPPAPSVRRHKRVNESRSAGGGGRAPTHFPLTWFFFGKNDHNGVGVLSSSTYITDLLADKQIKRGGGGRGLWNIFPPTWKKKLWQNYHNGLGILSIINVHDWALCWQAKKKGGGKMGGGGNCPCAPFPPPPPPLWHCTWSQ